MKKTMALIALVGMVFVGCAHKEKTMGGSSDQSTSSYSSGSSNPSKNSGSDVNSSNLVTTNSNTSNPQQQ